MLFNSFDFIVFFPIVVFIFFIIPQKFRSIWLLISSYYFYMSWNPKYALLIAASTIITFASGLLLDSVSSIKGKGIIVGLSFASNLGILLVFKYANFVITTVADIMEILGVGTIDRRLDILLPVGISFYTFQALGYTVDVYRGKITAEKNLINYALFVSFFPQLVAGPIERSGNLLKQIRNIEGIKVFNYERIKDGLILMLWGLFQKLVIADRVSILVNNVYNNYQSYGFMELCVASVLFAFQIYCDFGGYTNIAIGAAKVMGFELMNNFRQPYLATDIKDFWRRWHISLTTWFTDYLYIPLGGNRKGIIRKYINILIVFGVSGLWHGASWNYVVWGLIHAILQIVGDMKRLLVKHVGITCGEDSLSKRIRHIVLTFILVDFAWIFFAADSVQMAVGVIKQMCIKFNTSSIFELGLDRNNWKILLFSLAILITIDVIHEQNMSVRAIINRQEIWAKAVVYNILLWMVILFGVYGFGYDTSQFIYFQF